MTSAMQNILQLLRENHLEDARTGILKLVDTDPTEARANGVTLAHLLVICAGWDRINSLLPPGCNGLTSTGWLNSLLRAAPVDAHDAPVPWFTYPAIDFLDRLDCSKLAVFEWGGGNSTLWWAKRVRSVVAVDHNPSWYEIVLSRMPPNAHISLQTQQEDYLGAIAHSSEPFDVVVIDGQHRNDCVQYALEHSRPSGLIILDNSDRRAYKPGIERLMSEGYRRLDFFGWIPSYLYRSCTSIFFKEDRYLTTAPLPCEISPSLGPTCAQVRHE